MFFFFVVHEIALNIHERNIRAMFVKFRGCFFVVHEIALNIHERNIRARFVKFRGCFFCCPRNSTKHSRKKYSYKVCEVSWMFFFVVHEKTLNVHERNIRAWFVKFRGCFFCVLKQKKHFVWSASFVGEGGLEPPNSSEDRFTVCCNCHYATPPICH